jgi:hypothetical protein
MVISIQTGRSEKRERAWSTILTDLGDVDEFINYIRQFVLDNKQEGRKIYAEIWIINSNNEPLISTASHPLRVN